MRIKNYPHIRYMRIKPTIHIYVYFQFYALGGWHMVYLRINNYPHIHYMRIKSYPYIHYMRIKPTIHIYVDFQFSALGGWLKNLVHHLHELLKASILPQFLFPDLGEDELLDVG